MRTPLSLSLSLSLSLLAAACGGADKPTPTTPDPDPTAEAPADDPAAPELMAHEQCEAAGGSVVGDIGDGSVQCPEGTVEIGNVSGGVEAQLCCQPTPDGAE